MIPNERHNPWNFKSIACVLLCLISVVCLLASCGVSKPTVFPNNYVAVEPSSISDLQRELEEYVNAKDTRIGIAVILNRRDTVSVNGNRDFPMMSVFKFPVALALTRHLIGSHNTMEDSISVKSESLIEDTWSPMLKKYGKRDMALSYWELLEWALIESDNNATDILIEDMGGIEELNTLLATATAAGGIIMKQKEESLGNFTGWLHDQCLTS